MRTNTSDCRSGQGVQAFWATTKGGPEPHPDPLDPRGTGVRRPFTGPRPEVPAEVQRQQRMLRGGGGLRVRSAPTPITTATTTPKTATTTIDGNNHHHNHNNRDHNQNHNHDDNKNQQQQRHRNSVNNRPDDRGAVEQHCTAEPEPELSGAAARKTTEGRPERSGKSHRRGDGRSTDERRTGEGGAVVEGGKRQTTQSAPFR